MLKKQIIVGIETSCDDTSIGIVSNNKLLANVTTTSLTLYKKYGGIVPELAARSHCSNIDKTFKIALDKAKISINDISYIAYTSSPGLVGSLHVGKVFANQLAKLINKPIIKINHMFGHIFSYFVDHDIKKLQFPLITMVVSGGHTFIARVENIDKITYLNETVDDAVGEVLDKIGRYLLLDYPGGLAIDKIYNPKKTMSLIPNAPVDAKFSFSGIKTACLNKINSYNMQHQQVPTVCLASSSLEWVTNDLIRKLLHYLSSYQDTKIVLIGGGVSANKLLRKKLSKIHFIPIYLPSLKYTNDNGAMIATYAKLLINQHKSKYS